MGLRLGRNALARPCDYTGLSYERLSGQTGIPWPCTADEPDGVVRLYGDGSFPQLDGRI